MRDQCVLITGGAGYVGAMLVPRLLEAGYKVTVLDLMLYGANVLPVDSRLTLVTGDIRDQKLLRRIMPGNHFVIHLACISNDPSFDLNPELGKSINFDAFRPLVEISKASGVERFIYASSSSVYGIKEEADVSEETSLDPLTDYSRFKAHCEEILSTYQSALFTTVTIRPATVCGFSPRQRLDVVVNILTNLAYHKREISVYGGNQLRPNIHIADMVEAYLLLLRAPALLVAGKVFNAGYENQPVIELARTVKAVVGRDVKLVRVATDDNRSYHISSRRIRQELGFVATHTIREAVTDLVDAFKKGHLPDSLVNDRYFNIQKMKNYNLS